MPGVKLGGAFPWKKFMWRLPILSTRALAFSFLCLFIPFAFCCAELFLMASPQTLQHRPQLHSVISQSVLAPPLRSPEAYLRYSPDGKYLLFQDPSGIVVMSREPFNIVLRISAEDTYPAQFSRDSRSVTLISRALNFGKWQLPEGKKIAHGSLPIEDGCLDAQLSPDGELFACVRSNPNLALYELSSQKLVFESAFTGLRPTVPGHVGEPFPVFFFNYLGLDFKTAFARPFGLLRTSNPRPSPGRSLSLSTIHFSPDGKLLIAKTLQGGLGLDIDSKKRFDYPEALHKTANGEIDLQSSERAVAVENAAKSESLILSLKDGRVLSHPAFTADYIRVASNPRYAILYHLDSNGRTATAFDLEQNSSVEVPPAACLDIYGREIAVYNATGSISLYRRSEHESFANLPLPLGSLPELHSASVTPELEQLAFSLDGTGAIFEIKSGKRLGAFTEFSAAGFADLQTAFLLMQKLHQDPSHILRVETPTGASSTAWSAEKELQLRGGGPILLAYSLKQGQVRAPWELSSHELQLPFRLRGLDPFTGNELWKREFDDNPPTPFADPQGERLVLGWKAKSSGAKEAASHDPVVRALYKSAKLTDHDSFFEILDARTGKPVGGVLVQVGNGPDTFDSAFSVGDVMILVKDGVRVSIYSLHDGKLNAHLVGVRPAASSQSNLLAMDQGNGRLTIFDLSSGTKLDEQPFPEEIAYSHFSADGKRLFVLTAHQTAFIFDVSKVREYPAAAPDADKKEN
jgi:WD40 repeat protein